MSPAAIFGHRYASRTRRVLARFRLARTGRVAVYTTDNRSARRFYSGLLLCHAFCLE